MRLKFHWLCFGCGLWLCSAAAASFPLAYAPTPADNPLKGFVPYLRADATFPHSLEWDYTKLSEVMTGPTNFDWTAFDRKLEAAASRGHQFIARFYLEWPGKTTGVPRYLIDAGLLMRTWTNSNTQPWPPAVDHTPDYEDPRLRAALTNFIHALGARYDGDPRLGFLELGLLGTWGEWHNHPNNQWFASKDVQREVLEAYETCFRRTRLLARYPAGPADPRYAENHRRAMGYHDDSFAWATVHTGKASEAWFFESRLRAAGAVENWRNQPIGGEVRPEVWSCLFNEPTCAPAGQEFDRCVGVTHASWLCNEGVFRGKLQGAARERALRAAQRLGYELYVATAEFGLVGRELAVSLTVTNTGVAPFYYDWPIELAALAADGTLAATWRPDWRLTGIRPGEPAVMWPFRTDASSLPGGDCTLLVHAANVLSNGPPLRFANEAQDRDRPGWLTLGKVRPATMSPRFPLRVSENRRYLEDAAGTPFLVVGDTPWSLIAQLNEADIARYLDDRAQRGFTALIVNLLEHKFGSKAPAKLDGVAPFLEPGDFTQPNPAYFDYAHRAVAAAGERGLSVWLCPAYLGWGGKDEGFFQEIKAAGRAALRGYGRFVGARFKDLPNLVWMMGGDYALPAEERWAGEELALGLREGGAEQLMTAHGGQTSATETFGDQSWLAVDTVYRYQPDLWRPLRAAWLNEPTRPFVMIESAYEGEHQAAPDRIRRQAWWPMLCGACGQFFGNNPIWYFDGPGFTDRKSAPTWQQALDLPGSRDMARLGRLFRQYPWWRLVPDVGDRLIAAGGGDGAEKATAAHTPDWKLALLYVAGDGRGVRALTLDLSSFPGPVTARWYNPAQDAPLALHNPPLSNSPGQVLRTPGDNGTGANDWVLVLEVQ